MVRVAAMLTSLLLLVVMPVWAAEMEGKIKSWDAAGNTLVLDDGTQLSITSAVKVDRAQLKEGATVKVSYDEKDGKKVVNAIEVK